VRPAGHSDACRRLVELGLKAKGENSVDETNAERSARLERENKEREDQLRRIPLQAIDASKWPHDVRPIAIAETGGLGIDGNGRLHWNGKPVEIVGRRLDLTRTQAGVASLPAGLQRWPPAI
jgi:hypothetical protein